VQPGGVPDLSEDHVFRMRSARGRGAGIRATGTPVRMSVTASGVPDVPTVDVTASVALVDAGGVLLDVREPDEWAAGHAPSAMFIPMGDVMRRISDIPADRSVAVICRSGRRSALVVDYLVEQGLDARNVAGGMQAWQSLGLMVVRDDGTTGTVI
jgi:rhodanese-related sulfurtransferase